MMRWTRCCWIRRTPETPGGMSRAGGSLPIALCGRNGSPMRVNASLASDSMTQCCRTSLKRGWMQATKSCARQGVKLHLDNLRSSWAVEQCWKMLKVMEKSFWKSCHKLFALVCTMIFCCAASAGGLSTRNVFARVGRHHGSDLCLCGLWQGNKPKLWCFPFLHAMQSRRAQSYRAVGLKNVGKGQNHIADSVTRVRCLVDVTGPFCTPFTCAGEYQDELQSTECKRCDFGTYQDRSVWCWVRSSWAKQLPMRVIYCCGDVQK